jgi:hypothetical protein
MPSALSNPTLQRLHSDIARLSAAFSELAGGLSPSQLRWRPDVGAWGIAHCLDHLVAASRAYEPELESALQRTRGRANGAGSRLRPGVIGRWLMTISGPDSRGRPLACPRILAPSQGPSADVLERFLAGQRRLQGYLEAADGVDINSIPIRPPTNRLLRVSLGEAFELATGHAHRHLEQARRVRAHPRFPLAQG